MNIDTIITHYLQEKEKETAAHKAAAADKELLLQFAAGKDMIETDEYTLIFKKSTSIRLDTKKLYHDFGESEIKSVYGTESTSTTIIAAEKASAEKKSA